MKTLNRKSDDHLSDSQLLKSIIKRLEKIDDPRLSKQMIDDYIEDLPDAFDPDAYRNISDEDLINDVILYLM